MTIKIDQLSYEERFRLNYRNQLKVYKKFLSNYYWHNHITFRLGKVTGTDDSAIRERNKFIKKFLGRLRCKLGLKSNQLLYAWVHETGGGGHAHLIIQFRKYILKSKIYLSLGQIKKEYSKNIFIEIHYHKKNSRWVFVQSQEKTLSYITKPENECIDKSVEWHPKLRDLGMSYDIFNEANKAAKTPYNAS